MPFFKLKKTERRKVAIFFSCLAIAAFAWLFFALSNQYVYSIKTVVNYTNLPQNKAFHPLQSDTVIVNVEGTGWELLFSKISLGPEAVKVNLKTLAQRNYVTFTEQLKEINRNFHSSQRVISVLPDTLYFDFSSRSIKKVPVKLLYKMTFKHGFDIADSINIEPGEITVTGPINDIADITEWSTDTLRAAEVKAPVSARIALQKPVKNNITIYPAIAEVKVPVSEFTEKSVELPVNVLHKKRNTDVKLLPSKVRVTFLVSLTRYAGVTREDFDAAVDLNNWSEKGYRQLPVILIRKPEFAKVLKIEPQIIDFIVR